MGLARAELELKAEPKSQFSPAQLAFLERKAAYAAGFGTLFPKECYCEHCDGAGTP